MKVAAIQHRIIADPKENRAAIARAVATASKDGAELIVLPELHDYLYFCQECDPNLFKLAQNIPGEATDFYSQLAKDLKIVLVISLFEHDNGNYFNTAVVIDSDGNLAGTYRKVHIPQDAEYNESYYFDNGTKFTSIATSVGKLGMLICYDQWFPEAARANCLLGADILVIPTAIGYNPHDSKTIQQQQLQAWHNIQVSHTIANCIPLISCNRVGKEAHPSMENQHIDFWGNSFICAAFGNVCSTSNNQPGIITADISLKHKEQYTKVWPFIEQKQPIAY